MMGDLMMTLFVSYLLWELWSGTSRIGLRFKADDIGGVGGGSIHEFYRDAEDGSGYFWISWFVKAGMLGLCWIVHYVL
jgi:hypothetical protein